ncbi:hypothetical protein [Citricoccus sp. GCM10030269]|uniref:hypothetical protein n=1 Tax=Citricoccus sp. GCM10030269 TaxID=3273388 RepID=UPI00362332E5
MEPYFVIALALLALTATVLGVLSWAAYAGRTTVLWIRGVRPLIGGRYWFVLSPAILIGSLLCAAAMVLVEVNPETAGTFRDSPGNPLPASIVAAACVFLIVSLVASYWLPEGLKPGWIREREEQECRAEAPAPPGFSGEDRGAQDKDRGTQDIN